MIAFFKRTDLQRGAPAELVADTRRQGVAADFDADAAAQGLLAQLKLGEVGGVGLGKILELALFEGVVAAVQPSAAAKETLQDVLADAEAVGLLVVAGQGLQGVEGVLKFALDNGQFSLWHGAPLGMGGELSRCVNVDPPRKRGWGRPSSP